MFTCYGKETKKITKLFKETNVKIAFQQKKNTKPSKASPTKRRLRKRGHIPNEMYGLPIKIYRANRPTI
jgi:ribosomal protein L25 (general stress protein Ctc)